MKRIPPLSKLRQEVEKVFIGWEIEGHSQDLSSLLYAISVAFSD